MAKRNSKREPVKEIEEAASEDEEDLDELELDGDDGDIEDESADDGEADEAEDVDAEGDEDEIEDAMLELMAAQAEEAQRRAAAGAAAPEKPQASTRTQGKSHAGAAAAAVEGAGAGAGAVGGEAGDDSSEEDAGPGSHGPDPGSDSSEDERPNRNTVGNVPLVWYKDEDHIGYDIEGARITKAQRKDRLQQLLDRNDSKKALRTIYDPYNDEEITLSREELAMVMRIRAGQFPHLEVNPHETEHTWFTDPRDAEVMPIVDRPEPKSRFVPSKWEEQKIVKLVRAIRKGWIKVAPKKTAEQEEEERGAQPPAYLLWADDGLTDEAAGKAGSGLTYIPAPKLQLPGHADSYNPPAEYLPTEEEVAAWQMADPEDRPKALPQAFTSLRSVPAYTDFIKERFERCLDLYLCPRVRRKRLDIKSPEQLVPQLPKPRDLQPFPTTLALAYEGHTGPVASIAPDPWTGQWLLSGGRDGTLRLWEVRTGRCWRTWVLEGPVNAVAWCPQAGLRLVSAAVGNCVVLLPSGTGPEEAEAEAAEALRIPAEAAGAGEEALARWEPFSCRPVSGGSAGSAGEEASSSGQGLCVRLKFPVRSLAWHGRGDYFASVAPTGNTQAVVVHQLSKRASQNPFRKNRGRVVRVAFHPAKPFFFVATQNHVRVYNLAKQALAKKLLGGGGVLSCLALHPGGDHVLVGSDDKRVAWYDLDLSTKPYKALRYHTAPPRAVAFHRSYPLFASAADDGTVQVFHGMVYADLLTNPLIVPVKILRGGHQVVASEGVADCAFHPTQPWIFTAGADSKILLYCN
ncbi:hypothetical protein HXX76_000982 [Chlamydomonas incerta]|uniref:Ribosome biogenesis protein BOP1 homolog n=1 Tax=Chlamydomonas incerta TaxID=51695 RepID=A0A835WFA0_CHLIN|nr:hypothetical protein HXX76_000982 [Chlamydomonas incerta]|eukprot:KAG2446397.1 hypothetical protein HXX76_000982 [Chlamydomonas incerta]